MQKYLHGASARWLFDLEAFVNMVCFAHVCCRNAKFFSIRCDCYVSTAPNKLGDNTFWLDCSAKHRNTFEYTEISVMANPVSLIGLDLAI